MEAALYTRISLDPGNDRLGVQRQERECRELAERMGWSVRVYEDDDRSAYRPGKRPAFRRMLGDVEAGEVGAILAWHPDRLYRHPKDLEWLVDVCERHRVPIHTIAAGGLDLGTASGRMVARMLGAAARHEVEHMAERIRLKHEEKARLGKPAGGGYRAYGCERDSRTLVTEEAERIREAAARVLGGESLRAICRDWNNAGVDTVTGKDSLWRASTLRKLLVSARISGRREVFIRDGKRLVIGDITSHQSEWPAIISVAESDRLRAMFAAPARRRPNYALSHLLTSIASCSLCGSPLVARGTLRAGQRRIGCSKEPESRSCGMVVCLAEPFEHLVTEALLRHLEQGPVLRALQEQDDEAMRQVHDQLQAVRAQEQALALMWTKRKLSQAAYEVAQADLMDQAARLEAALVPDRQVLALSRLGAGPIREAWTRAPLNTRRQVLRAAVESITLAPASRHGRHSFEYERVTIRWRG